jgi:hypothetical protein
VADEAARLPARPHHAETAAAAPSAEADPKSTNSKEARMTDRLIHPKDWQSYVRYARSAKSADWRPPLVTIALTKFDKAVDSLTPRQIGLFLLFIFGYAASALLDPQEGPLSRRAFPDGPDTWRRRVVHKVTRDDVKAWRDAGLIEFTDAEGTLIDGQPTTDESQEREREQGQEAEHDHDREQGREPERARGRGREPEQGREGERGNDRRRDANPDDGRVRPDDRSRDSVGERPGLNGDNTAPSAEVCEECGRDHAHHRRCPFLNPVLRSEERKKKTVSPEQVNAFRVANGKKPWTWE